MDPRLPPFHKRRRSRQTRNRDNRPAHKLALILAETNRIKPIELINHSIQLINSINDIPTSSPEPLPTLSSVFSPLSSSRVFLSITEKKVSSSSLYPGSYCFLLPYCYLSQNKFILLIHIDTAYFLILLCFSPPSFPRILFFILEDILSLSLIYSSTSSVEFLEEIPFPSPHLQSNDLRNSFSLILLKSISQSNSPLPRAYIYPYI